MIHIALCFSDSSGQYYTYAGTTMLSVMCNSKADITFHLVADHTFCSKHRQEILSMVESRGQRVICYESPIIADELAGKMAKQYGIGALYRLYLHEILPIDKVLYLDCDIIADLDVAELYATDVENVLYAAVPDSGYPVRRIVKAGIELNKYVNTGVMLINLAMFRKHAPLLSSICSAEFSRASASRLLDQDIMNLFAKALDYKALYLSERYNFLMGYPDRVMPSFDQMRNKIVHLTWPKPWKCFSTSSVLFWKYYSQAPWGAGYFDKIMCLSSEAMEFGNLTPKSKGNRSELRRKDLKELGLFGYMKKRLFHKKNRFQKPARFKERT